MKHTDLIGLTFEVARDMCAQNAVKYRVSRNDGESMLLTADYVRDRMNLTLATDGRGISMVIAVHFG